MKRVYNFLSIESGMKLNIKFGSKFREVNLVEQQTAEEGRKIERLRRPAGPNSKAYDNDNSSREKYSDLN